MTTIRELEARLAVVEQSLAVHEKVLLAAEAPDDTQHPSLYGWPGRGPSGPGGSPGGGEWNRPGGPPGPAGGWEHYGPAGHVGWDSPGRPGGWNGPDWDRGPGPGWSGHPGWGPGGYDHGWHQGWGNRGWGPGWDYDYAPPWWWWLLPRNRM